MDEFEQFLKQQPLRQVSPDWRSELLRAAESVRPATPFQRWRRWSTLAAAAALAAMIGGGALYLIRRQQPTPAGRIAELVGSAEVRVGDKAKPMAAKPGMALCDGSRVLTGDGNSRCRLALATGDVVVTVMASSEVILKGGRADRQ